MARATCLCPSSLSRALLPILYHRTTLSSSVFGQNRFGSAVRRRYSTNQTRFHVAPVQAKAKRGLTSKPEEVASVEDLQFDVPLKIVEYPDPKLRVRNKRIETFDDNLKKLVDEMFKVMYKTDGYGLSAPQVGVNVQLMVFNPAGEEGEGQEIVLVNPKVNKYSKKTRIFNEGCLSFPGIYADVELLVFLVVHLGEDRKRLTICPLGKFSALGCMGGGRKDNLYIFFLGTLGRPFKI
ncbi:hypothetical protein SLEP1_g45321 [Rubroshorea leprosula]|uniref:Peptide deformylase n=1 Tax=Rubroshorea leprosula TaxID=152421 RepID=A0AAV5LL86_9ROSI|nr:hypothetical protein SLEP1_g45321 [Rubroshorea leprosula]